jgi:plasmid segregation protein ParM
LFISKDGQKLAHQFLQKADMQKNVLAIDVGYGHVKWIAVNANGERQKGMFPSVAAITTRDRSVEANGMSNLRTVTVNIGEHNYVVGRDAYLQTDAHFSRTRLNDYSQTNGYKALMLGAMAVSGLREIDQLVIGLPLSTLGSYHGQLQEFYKGEHLIGASSSKRKSAVAVVNVTVTSQPAGAIVHAAKVDVSLRKKTNLVIDVGYFTVDYLMCQGLKPFYERCGAIEGGMSSYYDHLGGAVTEQLAKAGFAKTPIDHFRLEKALIDGVQNEDGSMKYTLPVRSQTLDISTSVARAKIQLEGYVDRIVTGMGSNSLETVNSIVLAGGGGAFLLDGLKKRIGNGHEFVQLAQSQFAIAQGYAELGIAAAKRTVSATA